MGSFRVALLLLLVHSFVNELHAESQLPAESEPLAEAEPPAESEPQKEEAEPQEEEECTADESDTDDPEPLISARDVQMLGNLYGRQFRLRLHRSNDFIYTYNGYIVNRAGRIPITTLRLHNRNSNDFDLRSRFNVIPGVDGRGVSFQSVAEPTMFLCDDISICELGSRRHRYFTWIPRLGLADRKHASFENAAKPGYYLSAVSGQSTSLQARKLQGSSAYKRAATWQLDITENIHTKGLWKLVYGNNNVVNGGEYTLYKEIGTEMTHSNSRTTASKRTWERSIELEGSGGREGLFSASVKQMFKAAGEHSVTVVSTQSFKKFSKRTETQKYTMRPGKGFYLWQWQLECYTVDGMYMHSYTNLYHQTSRLAAPPRPATGPRG